MDKEEEEIDVYFDAFEYQEDSRDEHQPSRVP